MDEQLAGRNIYNKIWPIALSVHKYQNKQDHKYENKQVHKYENKQDHKYENKQDSET